MLESISKDSSLLEMLDSFARTIERQSADMLCSILLLDGTTLHHGAAPGLPAEYCQAIDGATIGPSAGSCGTAAFLKRQVIVSNIATDPLWADYRQLALPHGLKACWSTPIIDSTGKVLGTFDLYYRTPRKPNEHDLRLIATWTHLAALGIERKQAEESLKTEQRLLQHLYDSQEYERKLAAYEIHDGIAQYAAAAIMHLESYLRAADGASPPPKLQLVDHLLQKTLSESRRLINGLRPPILDERGIVAAVEHLVEEQSVAGPRITFEAESPFPRLAPVLETAIFRIIQEALTNAKKHSGSRKIEITVRHDGRRIHLQIRDWGKGFVAARVPEGHHGLRGIRERVRLLDGKVSISSRAGKGTSISVDLPILMQRKEAQS